MSDPVSYGLLVAAALIVGIVTILLFTRAPQRRSAPPGMGAALMALADQDRKEARRILTDAIRRSESSPEAFLVLGRLLREDGEAERALGLHRALLARPRLAAGNRLAAELEFVRDLIKLDRFTEALERVATLGRHFNDPQIVDLHARALIGAGRLEAAAEVWLKGIRGAKPGLWRLRGTRFLAEVAREYLRLGQPETAERWAKQALKIEASTALAEVVLGDIDRGQDNDRAARKHYERALHEGGAQWVLPRLIDHSLEQGQIDRLIDVLEPARQDRQEDPFLARAVLDLRLRRGDRDEFFALLESGDVPEIDDPAVWAGWTRHLLASEDAAGLNRLLSLLPAAFGPRSWGCNICGAEDHEPRAACLACGAPEPLAAHPVGEIA
jgi:lipopolysaccharide biosynthesis regulator YciM